MTSAARHLVMMGVALIVVLTAAVALVLRSGDAPADPPSAAEDPPAEDSAPRPQAQASVPAEVPEAKAAAGAGDPGPRGQPAPAEGPRVAEISQAGSPAPAAAVARPIGRTAREGAVYDRAILHAPRIERALLPTDVLRREVIKPGPRSGTQGGGPIAAPSAPLFPGPTTPCTVATTGGSAVATACQQGGRREAKTAMKKLLFAAKQHGQRFNCMDCHTELRTYTLTNDARTRFPTLLAAAR